MKIPKILKPALRQYQHNDCSGLVDGFDYKETIKITNLMERTIKAQSMLLIAYRAGGHPSEWVFDAIKAARKSGIEI